MELRELIELTSRAYDVLGWNGGGSITLEPNVMDAGDLWLYLDIHDTKIGADLLGSFQELKTKLETLFGNKQYGIEFNEWRSSDSGYGVSILLEGPE